MNTKLKTNKNSEVTNYYIRETQRNGLVFSIVVIILLVIIHNKVIDAHDKIDSYHKEHSALNKLIQKNLSLTEHLLKIEAKIDTSISLLERIENTSDPQSKTVAAGNSHINNK